MLKGSQFHGFFPSQEEEKNGNVSQKIAEDLLIEACKQADPSLTSPVANFEECVANFDKVAKAGNIEAIRFLGDICNPTTAPMYHMSFNIGNNSYRISLDPPFPNEKDFDKALAYYEMGHKQGDLTCTEAIAKIFSTSVGNRWNLGKRFEGIKEGELYQTTAYQKLIDIFYQFQQVALHVALHGRDEPNKIKQYLDLYSYFIKECINPLLKTLENTNESVDETTKDYLFTVLKQIIEDLNQYIKDQKYDKNFITLLCEPSSDKAELLKDQHLVFLEEQFRVLFDSCCKIQEAEDKQMHVRQSF